MNIGKTAITALIIAVAGVGLAASACAQDKPATNGKPASPPSEAEMMNQMVQLAQPGENHKLLAALAGTWDYKVKFWMTPGGPPNESSGVTVRTPIMGGRYFSVDSKGKMQMPGADGKMQDLDFEGQSIEGYDNAKKKFFTTWTDNMGTGILISEGTYSPATKTFTYNAEEETVPGMKIKVKELVKVTDADHYVFEWYEKQGSKETKTMEIDCTRQK